MRTESTEWQIMIRMRECRRYLALFILVLSSQVGCRQEESQAVADNTPGAKVAPHLKPLPTESVLLNVRDYDHTRSKGVEYVADEPCGAVLRRTGPPGYDTTAAFVVPRADPGKYKLIIESLGRLDPTILVAVNGEFIAPQAEPVQAAKICSVSLRAVSDEVELHRHGNILLISGNIPDLVSIRFDRLSASRLER
jgi:sulfur carrier protein ThiS